MNAHTWSKTIRAVPDADLEIRGGGGMAVIQTFRKGAPGLQRNFFRPFGPQFGLKIRGPPLPSPGSATVGKKSGQL